MKEVVTIMRKWNNPEINMWIDNKSIGLSMDLEDFSSCVIEDFLKNADINKLISDTGDKFGRVATVFRKKTFKSKLEESYNSISEKELDGIKNQLNSSFINVIKEIKRQSTKVV